MKLAGVSLMVCALGACGRVAFEPGSPSGDGAIANGGDDAGLDAKVPCPGLVTHWLLDEMTGSTTIADETGTATPGSLSNMDPATDWVAGHTGNALDFDGVDDRVIVPAPVGLANLGPATWMFWMFARSADAGTVIYKSDGNVAEGWWVEVRTANMGLGLSAVYDANNLRRFTSQFPINVWTHIAITWDGTPQTTGVTIYVDGNAAVIDGYDMSGNGNRTSDATRAVILGSGDAGSNGTFNGVLDDVRIFNRILSPSEIQNVRSGAGC